ncbi:unnamed protein product, partial [Polarella glacialis]
VHIERDVVFGSSVLLVNNSAGIARSITLRKAACVLDNSCVLSGSVIPEGALLGSFTVVPEGQKLEAMTVYTGCVKGSCVRLFQRPLLPGERIEGERVVTRQETGLEAAAPPPPLAPVAVLQRQLEAKALHRHTSCFWFTLFNVWCVLSSVVFAPLSDLLYWLTILIDFQIYDYFKDSGRGETVAVLMIAPMYIVVSLTMLAMMCILKWILIGRWTAG